MTKFSPVRSFFHLHLVWRLVKHAGSPVANSVAWHYTRTALPNPALSHRVVGNWLGSFGGQLIQISASVLLKMELTLWEDISNIRGAQKLLMWRLLRCNSTTKWKNNSSSRPRILENRCFTDGGIIISRISPLFSSASFLKISITCSEPRSRQYGVALYPTVLPNCIISALLVTVSSRTDHELFAKK